MKTITIQFTPFTLRVEHSGNEQHWDVGSIEIYAQASCTLATLVGDDVYLEQFDARGQQMILDALDQNAREERIEAMERLFDARREEA